MDYYVRLTNFYHQFQAIGNNYNQTVKAIKNNFGEKRAYALLRNLEKATIDLVVLARRIIMLTVSLKKPTLSKNRGRRNDMVAKINRGASLYGAVIYNQQKVNESTARIISGNRMIADVTGNPEQVMRNTLWAFENYLLANRNTEKPVLHISLNPSVDDRLTDSQFAGFGKGVYATHGLRRPALHCIYSRGHRPQAYPYRFQPA